MLRNDCNASLRVLPSSAVIFIVWNTWLRTLLHLFNDEHVNTGRTCSWRETGGSSRSLAPWPYILRNETRFNWLRGECPSFQGNWRTSDRCICLSSWFSRMLRAIARNDHKWMKTDLQVCRYLNIVYSKKDWNKLADDVLCNPLWHPYFTLMCNSTTVARLQLRLYMVQPLLQNQLSYDTAIVNVVLPCGHYIYLLFVVGLSWLLSSYASK